MDAINIDPQSAHQLNGPTLAHVRLAIADLQACQALVLQGKPPSFSALLDAYGRIGLAIHRTKSEMEKAANEG